MEQILEISKSIWNAMQERNEDVLKKNIHPQALFVHMGVTLTRDEEIDVIKEGRIIYKQIDFEDVKVTDFPSVTVVLTKLKLTAIVEGNEVVNPFVVTEVYTKDEQLISLSYTRINY